MSGVACGRPGCAGSILDGYCDTCGLAPARSGAAAPSATGAAGSAGSPSQRFDVSRLTARSGRTSSSTRRRSRVGAGVVDIAPVTTTDPASVVMADPSVPEDRRFCPSCDAPVGRGKDGKPGRQAGFCASCGTRFDFAAKLKTGDLVAGQYEVAGALAHGGLGWIYLARDRNVSDRWCVLKGLLDAADPDAAEAAVAERRFLAEVAHPAIVEIYNFVNHRGQGYIVMEYVGGPSLKQITKARRQAGEGPMPVADAAAFVLAVLPAFTYLHDRGLVYCDFKPDNVIHIGDAVKLIDLGGVRRLDDSDAAIFGTVGYQAPEVPDTGPTIASDLYTIGRALLVLILDWPTWQRDDREQLPRRDDHAVLVEHDCLWRFLQRACAPDPAQRFADADEMADALHGVLCQVASAVDGQPRPRVSTRFGPPRVRLDRIDWRTLPNPILPIHPRLPNRVAGVADDDPATALALAGAGTDLSWGDAATVARAQCEVNDFAAASSTLQQLDPAGADAGDQASSLRVAWSYLNGMVAVAAEDVPGALALFEDAYANAPGEAACAFALAAAIELSADRARLEEAADLYEQVSVADPSWVAAVAGLARVLRTLDRPVDASRVLTAVPDNHPSRAEALTLACRAMERGGYDAVVAAAASEHVQQAGRGAGGRREAVESELAAALFTAAIAAIERREPVGATVAGRPADPKSLSAAAADALLELAEATPDADRRHRLLDQAARTRPWSLW